MPIIPITFNDTTPAAPGNDVNVNWQTDGSGNLCSRTCERWRWRLRRTELDLSQRRRESLRHRWKRITVGAAAVTVGSVSGSFSAGNSVGSPLVQN
jgi:hypothetical protein